MDHIHCNSKHYSTNISFDYKDTLIQLFAYFEEKNTYNITAFVRIDNQIKSLFGDYLYVFNILPKTNLNIELGWHPHISDATRAVQEIYTIHHANKDLLSKMKSVRMGGALMDNDIMATLSNRNFQIDSSALPSCYRDDEHRQYDWSITGNSAYSPFMHDYRCSGEPCHRITEIPMTTIYIEAPYDTSLQRRYLNPTIKNEIFQPAFANYCQYLPYAIIVFHPDQLISGYEDDLYRYGMDNFSANMEFIHKYTSNYKTISQLL